MYDDFKRAKQNLKKVLDLSVYRYPSNPDLCARHTPRFSKTEEADLDLDFYIGLDTYRLVTKDASCNGARYACLDQISTPARLQNLHLIKNLFTLLKSKIVARRQVEKLITEDSTYLGTCRLAAGLKTGGFNVNVLPSLPKKNVHPGFSSDFSSILEDANALESFLKVVAPVFMNYILAEKETTGPQVQTQTHPDLKSSQTRFCDKGTGNGTPSEFSPDDTPSSGGSLQENHTKEEHLEKRIFPNDQDHKFAAHENNFPTEKATRDTDGAQYGSISYDCEDFNDQGTSAATLKLEKTNWNPGTTVNTCNLDLFSQGQNLWQEQIPCYPSFEEQFEEDSSPSESSLLFQVNGSSEDITFPKVRSATNISVAGVNTLPDATKVQSPDGNLRLMKSSDKGTLDPLRNQEKNNLTTHDQDGLSKLPSSSELQSGKRIDLTMLNNSTKHTQPQCWSSCRYSLPGVNHGAPQAMIPLDFNLNALHIKPAFSDEQVAESSSRDSETFTSVGAHDAPTAQKASKAYCRRHINYTGLTDTASSDQHMHTQKLNGPDYIEEKMYCFGNARIMRDATREESDTTRQAVHGHTDHPALPVNDSRPNKDPVLTTHLLCPAVVVVTVICSACWMSSTPWEVCLLVATFGLCSLLALSVFDNRSRGCLNTRLQEYWMKISGTLIEQQDREKPQFQVLQPKKSWAHLEQSDGLPPQKHSELDKTPEKVADPTQCFNFSATESADHGVNNSSGSFRSAHEDVNMQSLCWSIVGKLPEKFSVEEKAKNDPRLGVDNCKAWGILSEQKQQTGALRSMYSQASTGSVSTMTDQLLEWVPDLGPMHEPDTCMASTMTESPVMTSSAAQTDDSTCSILDEDSDSEDSGQVQVVELPREFPLPVTATVGVQADMGARRLSQKTDKVRREHQMSLKRLRRKFLSIRRKCQIEALALKQSDQKKKNFLCQLQLSLPGLQQEKRSLLAERAAIERQFEDEKKKNRDLVGRLTRLNHQFSKLGQSQQHLLPPSTQSWRQHQHQPVSPYSASSNIESSNKTATSGMNTSTSSHSSQEENSLLHHRFNPHHQQQPQQVVSVSSGCRGSNAPGHCLSVFSQSKTAKLLTAAGGVVGSAFPLPQTKVAPQQQSTLLQTGHVRPNNSVPTPSGHAAVYQDHTPQQQQQQQQQQHARHQQQQQQILIKQQQILQQQQRLPIFQLFNRPAGQVIQEGSSAQQQQQQQQQKQ